MFGLDERIASFSAGTTIGVVIVEPGSYGSPAAVAARASEVKGVAKRLPGSKWVLDRRRPPERFS